MQIIANRIKQARLNKGLSQEELSKLCGWTTRARISNYENARRVPSAKEIIAISNVLDVSIDWLYGKTISPTLTQKLQQFIAHKSTSMSSNEIEALLSKCKFVPIVNTEDLDKHDIDNGYFTALELRAEYYEVTLHSVSSNAFAISVQGDSMESNHGTSFPQDTIVIIDPEKKHSPEDYVLAWLKDSSHIIFKKLISDSGKLYLKSLNPHYPMLELSKNIKILGKAIQSTLKL